MRLQAGARPRIAIGARQKRQNFKGFSGSGERENDRRLDLLGLGTAVRTSRAAGLGAGAKGLIDDGLDGARASAALRAATEAAVDLLGVAREVFRGVDGAADIVVGDDVTGTNNHEGGQSIGDARPSIFKMAT
jgi:hypothetical protein